MEVKVTIEADKLVIAMTKLADAILRYADVLQGNPIQNGFKDHGDFEEIMDAPEPQTTSATALAPATAPATTPMTAPATASVITSPYPPQAAVPVAPQPATPPVVQPTIQQPSPVPTAQAPTYTLDQLAQAAAVLRDAGKLSQLQALLQSFSVRSMQEIPPERYGEFATKLRELGAKI